MAITDQKAAAQSQAGSVNPAGQASFAEQLTKSSAETTALPANLEEPTAARPVLKEEPVARPGLKDEPVPPQLQPGLGQPTNGPEAEKAQPITKIKEQGAEAMPREATSQAQTPALQAGPLGGAEEVNGPKPDLSEGEVKGNSPFLSGQSFTELLASGPIEPPVKSETATQPNAAQAFNAHKQEPAPALPRPAVPTGQPLRASAPVSQPANAIAMAYEKIRGSTPGGQPFGLQGAAQVFWQQDPS